MLDPAALRNQPATSLVGSTRVISKPLTFKSRLRESWIKAYTLIVCFPSTDPCPPENIWVEEPSAGNCSVVWEGVPLVEYYITFIKRDDGTEKTCNTTSTRCPFFCMCGYTYLTSVFPYNAAGTSLFANVRNYTTSEIMTRRPIILFTKTQVIQEFSLKEALAPAVVLFLRQRTSKKAQISGERPWNLSHDIVQKTSLFNTDTPGCDDGESAGVFIVISYRRATPFTISLPQRFKFWGQMEPIHCLLYQISEKLNLKPVSIPQDTIKYKR